MRILFDNGTPRGVAKALLGHVVEEARSHGWDSLQNGELLNKAMAAGTLRPDRYASETDGTFHVVTFLTSSPNILSRIAFSSLRYSSMRGLNSP